MAESGRMVNPYPMPPVHIGDCSRCSLASPWRSLASASSTSRARSESQAEENENQTKTLHQTSPNQQPTPCEVRKRATSLHWTGPHVLPSSNCLRAYICHDGEASPASRLPASVRRAILGCPIPLERPAYGLKGPSLVLMPVPSTNARPPQQGPPPAPAEPGPRMPVQRPNSPQPPAAPIPIPRDVPAAGDGPTPSAHRCPLRRSRGVDPAFKLRSPPCESVGILRKAETSTETCAASPHHGMQPGDIWACRWDFGRREEPSLVEEMESQNVTNLQQQEGDISPPSIERSLPPLRDGHDVRVQHPGGGERRMGVSNNNRPAQTRR